MKSKRKLLASVFFVTFSIILFEVWYMNAKNYINTGFYLGNNEFAKADVTPLVKAGAEIIVRNGDPKAVRIKADQPMIKNAETLSKIKKAMLNVGKMILPKTDWAALETYNPQNSLQYLETYGFDSEILIHSYSVAFQSPSNFTIILYPQTLATDAGNMGKTGDLHTIWECNKNYAPCPEYMQQHDFSFLLNPEEY